MISITLPGDLLRKVDRLVKEGGYYSRSEVFRDAVRNLITEIELSKVETRNAAAIIMTISEYTRRDVDSRIAKIRHEFDDIIVENTHRHIGEKYCLEIFIIEGNSTRILRLIERIRGIRGIIQVKSLLMPL